MCNKINVKGYNNLPDNLQVQQCLVCMKTIGWPECVCCSYCTRGSWMFFSLHLCLHQRRWRYSMRSLMADFAATLTFALRLEDVMCDAQWPYIWRFIKRKVQIKNCHLLILIFQTCMTFFFLLRKTKDCEGCFNWTFLLTLNRMQ